MPPPWPTPLPYPPAAVEHATAALFAYLSSRAPQHHQTAIALLAETRCEVTEACDLAASDIVSAWPTMIQFTTPGTDHEPTWIDKGPFHARTPNRVPTRDHPISETLTNKLRPRVAEAYPFEPLLTTPDGHPLTPAYLSDTVWAPIAVALAAERGLPSPPPIDLLRDGFPTT
jgi:integrase